MQRLGWKWKATVRNTSRALASQMQAAQLRTSHLLQRFRGREKPVLCQMAHSYDHETSATHTKTSVKSTDSLFLPCHLDNPGKKEQVDPVRYTCP